MNIFLLVRRIISVPFLLIALPLLSLVWGGLYEAFALKDTPISPVLVVFIIGLILLSIGFFLWDIKDWKRIILLSLIIFIPFSIFDLIIRIQHVNLVRNIKPEIVIQEGTILKATTEDGSTITIRAEKNFMRTFTWDTCSFTEKMDLRLERWYGGLGIYSVGFPVHAEMCNGINRIVANEAQQHFTNNEEALKWIDENKQNDWYTNYAISDSGLLIRWGKNLDRSQMSIEVWQILINGEKPSNIKAIGTIKIN